MKCHRLGGFNSRHLFLTVREARSSRSRCQQSMFLLLAGRRPPSCCVSHGLSWSMRSAEREKASSRVSLIRTLIPWDQGLTFMASCNLAYLLRWRISEYIHTRVRASTHGSWGHTNTQPRTPQLVCYYFLGSTAPGNRNEVKEWGRERGQPL